MPHSLKMMLLGIFLVLLGIFCMMFGRPGRSDTVALILAFFGVLCFVGGFFRREE